MSTNKPAWYGHAVINSSERNASRLHQRLSDMAEQSHGLQLVFSPPTMFSWRSGGARGSAAMVSLSARNDDPNRIPTDVGRKVREFMGDTEVGVTVLVSSEPIEEPAVKTYGQAYDDLVNAMAQIGFVESPERIASRGPRSR